MNRLHTLALATALLLPMAGARAGIHLDAQCRFDSDYAVEFDDDRLSFRRKATEDAAASRIEFIAGGILIDGRPLALSDADARRAREFARRAQAMLPQVRRIAADSVDIAFVALGKVLEHFSNRARQAEVRAELDALHREAVEAIASARSSDALQSAGFEQRIESAVKRIVPVLAGEFAAQAISAAMSGDEQLATDIERRAERLEQDIEASVEGAAKALEARAAALCPQFEALDAIDDAFEWRLPDGSKVDLLDYRPAKAVAGR